VGVKVISDVFSLPLETSVIINFTAPQATAALLDGLGPRKTALVIGTTGMTAPEIDKVKRASVACPVVFSPNMSLGVNLLFTLPKWLPLGLRTISISRSWRPTTALKKTRRAAPPVSLGIAASALGMSYEEAIVDGRAGMVGERPKKEIGMHAVRGGDIVGDHTVLFAALGERLELKHMAHSRGTFARGAVLAAKWLSAQKPGLYTMKEVLGL